jgi:hypothetical protein
MMRGHLQVIYEQSALPILNPKASAMFLNICRNTCDLMDGRIRATTPMGMPGRSRSIRRSKNVGRATMRRRRGAEARAQSLAGPCPADRIGALPVSIRRYGGRRRGLAPSATTIARAVRRRGALGRPAASARPESRAEGLSLLRHGYRRDAHHPRCASRRTILSSARAKPMKFGAVLVVLIAAVTSPSQAAEGDPQHGADPPTLSGVPFAGIQS